MEAKNLRSGNLVYYKAENDDNNVENYICKIDGADIHQMEGNAEYSNAHEPIFVTEKWLLDLGFEKYHGVYRVRLGQDKHIRGHIVNEAFNCCIYDSTCDIEGRVSINIGDYKYVHELQNLFFALTGRELELKNGKLPISLGIQSACKHPIECQALDDEGYEICILCNERL